MSKKKYGTNFVAKGTNLKKINSIFKLFRKKWTEMCRFFFI